MKSLHKLLSDLQSDLQKELNKVPENMRYIEAPNYLKIKEILKKGTPYYVRKESKSSKSCTHEQRKGIHK